jgi:hypothetical protein
LCVFSAGTQANVSIGVGVRPLCTGTVTLAPRDWHGSTVVARHGSTAAISGIAEEEEEEPYLLRCTVVLPASSSFVPLYPTLALPTTAPVSKSFGLRSSYEIDILDTDQRPRNWIDLGTSSDPSSPFITDQCQEQYLAPVLQQ